MLYFAHVFFGTVKFTADAWSAWFVLWRRRRLFGPLKHEKRASRKDAIMTLNDSCLFSVRWIRIDWASLIENRFWSHRYVGLFVDSSICVRSKRSEERVKDKYELSSIRSGGLVRASRPPVSNSASSLHFYFASCRFSPFIALRLRGNDLRRNGT